MAATAMKPATVIDLVMTAVTVAILFFVLSALLG
jgi:hypothetical protein